MWQSLYCWIFTFLVPALADIANQCVHFSPEVCSSSNGTCKTVNDTSICCHTGSQTLFLVKEAFGARSNVTSLYLYNVTVEELNMTSFLSVGFKLESLAVTSGSVQKINGIGNFTNIKCLNLSGNALTMIGDMNLKVLRKLNNLDLSQNNLTKLPSLNTHKLELDISGNARMRCSDIRDLMNHMKNSTLDFRNRNTTLCSMSNSFIWFNSTDSATLHQLEELNEVEKQCSEFQGIHKCQCAVQRFDFVAGQPMSVAFRVDCSNQQLDALPLHLPANTTFLNVSNNNISNLDALNKDAYRGIRELHADHNLISSITVLEYTGFINNFSVLSLRSNNLKSIPTYFLSNAFDRNFAARFVRLGGNKLKCDCNTAQVLKVWLMSNKKYVVDYKEVQCSNYPKNVVELDQQEVCVTHRVWTDYIYYIIAGEVTLLIFLVSKVSYDYWIFKTAGYLPWPASKLPKLPCDWVFET